VVATVTADPAAMVAIIDSGASAPRVRNLVRAELRQRRNSDQASRGAGQAQPKPKQRFVRLSYRLPIWL